MKRKHTWMLTCVVISTVGVLSGCSTATSTYLCLAQAPRLPA